MSDTLDLDSIEAQANAATRDFSVPTLRRNVLDLIARVRELAKENQRLGSYLVQAQGDLGRANERINRLLIAHARSNTHHLAYAADGKLRCMVCEQER